MVFIVVTFITMFQLAINVHVRSINRRFAL